MQLALLLGSEDTECTSSTARLRRQLVGAFALALVVDFDNVNDKDWCNE